MNRTLFVAIVGLIAACSGPVEDTVTPSISDVDADGYQVSDGDCDDNDDTVHPGASEVCDEVDSNCDGSLVDTFADTDDDGTPDCIDDDDDGDGTPDSADCAPLNAAVGPGVSEIVDNGIDDDCDGRELCYVDADADGYRTDSTVGSDDLACDGLGEASQSAPSGDCDDTDADRNPGASEVCGDVLDQDCDGRADCQDEDCDAASECMTFPETIQAAYIRSCCQWSEWGFNSQQDCEAEAVSWVTNDCLTTNISTLDTDVQDCLAATTLAVDGCLSSASTCDPSDVDSCWQTWSVASDSCGTEGWYEALCPPVFVCDAGDTQYVADQRCDGVSDCQDGLDELECYTCNDTNKLPAEWVCDGEADCASGDDEDGCFTCADGSVIPGEWLCDGIADCATEDDEVAPECYSCEPDPTGAALSVLDSQQCDGVPDCPQGDDENLCNGFVCDDLQRVDWSFACDGLADCADGSDETEALCPTFFCADGTTIPVTWQCDGFADCSSGIDEADCPTYTCFDGTEILESWLCDDIPDCTTGEDEQRCGMACQSVYDGSEYIPEQWVCDGIPDCVGNVDEYCTSCGDGVTNYHDSRNCDTIQDCGTGLDERCGTTDGVNVDAYFCSDGSWIYRSWLCDGEADCLSGEDEGGLCLAEPTCPSVPGIHVTQYCDSHVDCANGSDELATVCDWESLVEPPLPDPGEGAGCDALAWGVCNGVPECSSDVSTAADEVGCASNRCGDGTPYPDILACDGFPDCKDGGDEGDGCTSTR